MPFDTTKISSGQRITSRMLLDLYNVLTGVLTDQPITIGNNLTVTGTMTVSGQVFQPGATNKTALILRALQLQNADIFQVQDYLQNNLFRIDFAGVVQSPSLATPTVASPTFSGTAVWPAKYVPNAAIGTDLARPNLLTNGGVEPIGWQRGNGPFTATGAYAADRWKITLGTADTLSVSKDGSNQDFGNGSLACAACTYVKSGGGSTLSQTLKTSGDGTQLGARVVSFSVRVNTTTANAVRVGITSDGTGGTTTLSAFHTGAGAYQTLTVTATVGTNATTVTAFVEFDASCTAFVDSLMLVTGPVAADYAPPAIADDVARCLRYYELPGVSASGDLSISGVATAGAQTINLPIVFKVPKAVTPTVTKVGTWGVTNCAQPSFDVVTTQTARITITSTAAGVFGSNTLNAGAGMTVEANP